MGDSFPTLNSHSGSQKELTVLLSAPSKQHSPHLCSFETFLSCCLCRLSLSMGVSRSQVTLSHSFWLGPMSCGPWLTLVGKHHDLGGEGGTDGGQDTASTVESQLQAGHLVQMPPLNEGGQLETPMSGTQRLKRRHNGSNPIRTKHKPCFVKSAAL